MKELLAVDIEGRLATITLDDAQRRNVLGTAMFDALEERLFSAFFNDRNVPMRCVVVADARKQVAKAWGDTERAAANVRALFEKARASAP